MARAFKEVTEEKSVKNKTNGKWMGTVIFMIAVVVIIGLVIGYLAQIFTGYNGDITAKLIVELVMFIFGAVWATVSVSRSIKKWKANDKERIS
jgi:ABC-type transport system involved in multi-copper enzyme maturation permease subunit